MIPAILSAPAPLESRLRALLALQGRTEDTAALDAMMGGPCVLWANVGKVTGRIDCEAGARDRMRIRIAAVFRVPVHAFAMERAMVACLERAWEGASHPRQWMAVQILTESQQTPDTRDDGAGVGSRTERSRR